MRKLQSVRVKNFLSLKEVSVELHDLCVLVGPNGAGKSNFLKVFQFLGDTARLDLGPAVGAHGGYEAIRYRGSKLSGSSIEIEVDMRLTTYASDKALDQYALVFRQARGVLVREESFTYKRTNGSGRRITAVGSAYDIDGEKRSLDASSAILSTLPRVAQRQGGEQIRAVGDLFMNFRVFDVDVAAARRPAALADGVEVLAADASNLAPFLKQLHTEHREIFELLEQDLAAMLPGFRRLQFVAAGGSAPGVGLELVEGGLRGTTPLAAASFGTIRALGLLAMLHDPAPPLLSCVEEVDHGLHPYALDRIVDRLRTASERTQLLVATHSPALVNRLKPRELIVCERDPDTGATRMPAADPGDVAAMAEQSALSLGELWFSGALGGVPS
jgi:predicted ATPase